MIKLLQFSGAEPKTTGERALGVVVTFPAGFDAVADAANLETGALQWQSASPEQCRLIVFTFMADDAEQRRVFDFMREVVCRRPLAALLGKLRVQMQFPTMSEPVKQDTAQRVMSLKFDD